MALPPAVAAAIRAPLGAAGLRELLFCAIGAASAVAGVGALFGVPVGVRALVWLLNGRPDRTPSGFAPPLAGFQVALLALVLLAPRIARALGAGQRGLAAVLLGEHIAAPPPVARRRWGPA
ncbi:MAG TPA: hypothetical protein VJT31_07755, partial [Rugosimonospora sp.]|nr:hypothetical protein [Rugosimonospora sp.]